MNSEIGITIVDIKSEISDLKFQLKKLPTVGELQALTEGQTILIYEGILRESGKANCASIRCAGSFSINGFG